MNRLKTCGCGLLLFIVGDFLILLQCFISFYAERDTPSGSCLTCSYLENLLYGNVIILFTLPLFLLIYSSRKLNRWVWYALLIGGFLVLCSLTNQDMFYEKVAGWSTFSMGAVFRYATEASLYPMLLALGVFVPLLIKFRKASKYLNT